mmetsp:Transcript_15444/g.33373  ORF Transcript_15444/g.33373 Transcript_15444/m.33373 type:complete len:93 (+) Transcript_15444:426-704(+)
MSSIQLCSSDRSEISCRDLRWRKEEHNESGSDTVLSGFSQTDNTQPAHSTPNASLAYFIVINKDYCFPSTLSPLYSRLSFLFTPLGQKRKRP